jgi:hypothetical protein
VPEARPDRSTRGSASDALDHWSKLAVRLPPHLLQLTHERRVGARSEAPTARASYQHVLHKRRISRPAIGGSTWLDALGLPRLGQAEPWFVSSAVEPLLTASPHEQATRGLGGHLLFEAHDLDARAVLASSSR